MQVKDHRLTGVTQLDSPNFDERPNGEISLVVIHGISLPPGVFGGDEVMQLFLNQIDAGNPELQELAGLKVSSHLFVRRSGEVLQFVPFDQRAWHAGESSFNGRDDCNDFSIGIELEGTDTLPYEDVQYESLVDICTALMQQYGSLEIRGHADIAPLRKTDPGPAFDWSRFRRELAVFFR